MHNESPQLNEADARVIDALLEEGLDPAGAEQSLAKMSGADRARAEAALRLLTKLETLPAPAPSSELVPSLMARIDEVERDRRERMRVTSPLRRIRGIRIPDLVTIAAVLLLAVGVGWPLAQSVRSTTMREQCGRNMGSLYAGLSRYADDHDGQLPLAAGLGSFLHAIGDEASVKDASATKVDWRTYRHGEHLETLRELDYVGSRCLTCPGCENDRGAMALRVPAVGQRFVLGAMRGMLVADANPALELLRDGKACAPGTTTSSLNHDRRGQNVLFDDGSVRWLLSPVLVNGDSIWAPCDDRGPASSLERGLLPADPADVFLAQ